MRSFHRKRKQKLLEPNLFPCFVFLSSMRIFPVQFTHVVIFICFHVMPCFHYQKETVWKTWYIPIGGASANSDWSSSSLLGASRSLCGAQLVITFSVEMHSYWLFQPALDSNKSNTRICSSQRPSCPQYFLSAVSIMVNKGYNYPMICALDKFTFRYEFESLHKNLALLAKGLRNLCGLSFHVPMFTFIESKCVTNQYIGF